MTAEGYSTRRGRRAALVHRDEVNARVRGRRSSRLLALTSGGAIPEVADYRVVLEPEDTFIGTVNEDWAIESMGGDIFQLGNASWRIIKVGAGVVRVADAKGAPPTIPFWLGEAPARSDELSRAVSDLRADVRSGKARHHRRGGFCRQPMKAGRRNGDPPAAPSNSSLSERHPSRAGNTPDAADARPRTFLRESGGMQLVLHAPFGSRVNKAWGLALRKRFCRQFNFELKLPPPKMRCCCRSAAAFVSALRRLPIPAPATARDVLIRRFSTHPFSDALALEHDHLTSRAALSGRPRMPRNCSGCSLTT
jgi:ATP-dependent Lhr-like helicase